MSRNTSAAVTRPLAALRSFDAKLCAMVHSLSGWTPVFVGAFSVLFAETVAQNLPLGATARTLALLPLTLALLYGMIALAASWQDDTP